MSKHSPAPWFLGTAGVRVASNRGLIADCSTGQSAVSMPMYEREANARLIAMAPTPLKGLKLAVMEFERISYQKKCDAGVLETLKAAIAKAEGEGLP